MKTCKNFCDRYVEKIKKTQALNVEKTKKKLETIQKQPKTSKNLKKIKQYKFIIKEYKKNYKEEYEIWNGVCKFQFCNPGCKGSIYNPDRYPLVNNFSPHTNADYLRKEGAISGCLSEPFFF